MKKILISIVVVFSLFSGLYAQDAADKIVYKKETLLDFEDVMLEGQIKKPTGSFLMDRTKARFNSLIKMKENFNKELEKSVDLLK